MFAPLKSNGDFIWTARYFQGCVPPSHYKSIAYAHSVGIFVERPRAQSPGSRSRSGALHLAEIHRQEYRRPVYGKAVFQGGEPFAACTHSSPLPPLFMFHVFMFHAP